MTKYWKIVAWPDPAKKELNLDGASLKTYHDEMRKACEKSGAGAKKGWDFIADYKSLDDLIARVNAKVGAGDRLRVLELFDHGTPEACNGLDTGNLSTYAPKFKKFKWNDISDFYISGCNTGLPQAKSSSSLQDRNPIAKQLRYAMAFNDTVPSSDPEWFPFRITFYGAKGYTYGTHMLDESGVRTLKAEKSYTDPDGHDHGAYEDAEKATGDDCWNKFWNWQ